MENKDLYSDEIWADVEGYVGCYQVSTLGHVRNVKTGRILKPCNGRVQLYKDKHGKKYRVHRLVAAAFIPNPEGFSMVGRKDNDKTNNCIENLWWMSPKEYHLHLSRNRSKSPVSQYTVDGELIATYRSAYRAGKHVGIDSYYITCCARGAYETAGGYVWRFARGLPEHTADEDDED